MEPKDTFFSKKRSIKCRGEIIDLSEPQIMGILNITPDSFYDGGRYKSADEIKNRVSEMIHEGCDILDIGAFSTRPGAENITENEERNRLTPVLELIKHQFPDLILSVDTFRSGIAKYVVENFNVDIINDISAGDLDSKMLDTIAELNVPYIMMHMKGTPETMQQNPEYKNVVKEVIGYFSKKVQQAKLMGISDVIIDPGFGFGKTIEHNYQLLKHLDDFRIFELPVLVGLSRKSMIYKTLDISPDESLNGTTVLNTLALVGGANIVRVHDIKAAREAIHLVNKFSKVNVNDWYE
ncbi:MAG: dihydropteroate synthase [Bacteroidetes bacterium GWC2_33_15]|nr:MAG: dihydropteroate synthase [Bacteroidetes bacterium GWA2_33_15]OFX49686.1 MAG: dihydropteroate synthase [Bacteroidetes bacterium GWC2_33_15]OFX65924.1 MAG: dihydropteroate synthase [Bacteroidetes bacterium GWB2_32_14]OFX68315.1 MAG: dihydropteroate synthase [Bacteroidetes bacterium GWD2_33_33]HAN18099.1 dihydropteroate synthase [Bacteroidales bacterium]